MNQQNADNVAASSPLDPVVRHFQIIAEALNGLDMQPEIDNALESLRYLGNVIRDYKEMKHCAFDLDECTVTFALESEAQVRKIIEDHSPGNRVKVAKDGDIHVGSFGGYGA